MVSNQGGQPWRLRVDVSSHCGGAACAGLFLAAVVGGIVTPVVLSCTCRHSVENDAERLALHLVQGDQRPGEFIDAGSTAETMTSAHRSGR